MRSRLWIAIGINTIYWLIFRPDWRNLYLFLYDVPTLTAASFYGFDTLFAGSNPGANRRNCGIATLITVALLGWLAQYRNWPLSGHLTAATTIALMQIRLPERGNTSVHTWLLNHFAWIPVLLLIFIRTFRPQSDLMANRFNTVSALVIAVALFFGLRVLFPNRDHK